MITLDGINTEILELLQTDGRMTYRELGDRIGLTAPAIAERVRRLEDAGVITGYRAVVNYESLGFPILCVIRLNAPGSSPKVDEMLATIPEIVEANRVTGSESHVIRAHVRSTGHLEELLHRIWSEGGDSITNIVTSSPVPRRPMGIRATGAGRPTDSQSHER